jgi:hypothetical protein
MLTTDQAFSSAGEVAAFEQAPPVGRGDRSGPRSPTSAGGAPSALELSGKALVEHIANHGERSTHWIKTPEGPKHIKAPLTGDKLFGHVSGSGHQCGIAPIPPGTSSTRVALFDLDSHKGETPWPEMQRVARDVTARALRDGMHLIPFRSSGGQGIHLYALWGGPQDAYSVRALLTDILRDCGFEIGTGGISKLEIEAYPKTLEPAADKFGAMFVLPLGRKGQSVPLDPDTMDVRDRNAIVRVVASEPVEIVLPPARPERTSTLAPASLKTIESALAAIPNGDLDNVGYEKWRDVGYAVHAGSNASEDGFALWDDWSARNSKHDSEFARREVWDRADTDRPGGITVGYLFKLAGEHEWTESCEDDFDDVSDAANDDQAYGDRFHIIERDERAARPRPKWRIKNVLPERGTAMVFGASGSGKSAVVLDVCASIDRGLPWRGNRVTKGRVVYVAAEGADDFLLRMEANEQHHGYALDIGVIAASPNLLSKPDVGALGRRLKARGVDVLVLDTWARVTAGANENSGEEMGLALKHCEQLQRDLDCLVVIVHHSGKNAEKGARGWSGLKAAVDTEIEITRDGETRKLRISKQKGGRDGDSYPFKLHTVCLGKDEDGDDITSIVVEPCEAVRVVKAPKGPNEKIVLKAVHDLTDFSTEADGGVKVGDVLKEATSHMAKGDRDRRREYARAALLSLQADGFVAVDETDNVSRVRACNL